MDILSSSEIDDLLAKSMLVKKYNEVIDRESAYEILNKKIAQVNEDKETEEAAKQESSGKKRKRNCG